MLRPYGRAINLYGGIVWAFGDTRSSSSKIIPSNVRRFCFVPSEDEIDLTFHGNATGCAMLSVAKFKFSLSGGDRDVSDKAATFRTGRDFATPREGSPPSSSPCIWHFDVARGSHGGAKGSCCGAKHRS